jgi:hypothetical protein
MDKNVGKSFAAPTSRQVVQANEIDYVALDARFLADIANRGRYRTLTVTDPTAGKSPQPMTLTLLAQQHAAR